MSKFSICIIGVYFGKLPTYFNLWLKSCACNTDINFLIVTDNELYNLPANVTSIKMTLSDMKLLADKKLGLNSSLTTPYKCCDFKAVYGNIFCEYIKEYDFWGHCDFDLIFGDIRKFITDNVLEKYDKIFDLGHLALYRNTDKVNSYYKLPGSRYDYFKVFTTLDNYAFDERNCIYQIYKKNALPMYENIDYLDIHSIFTRFKAAHNIKNYINQVFYWENGKVIMAYKKRGKILCDEYIYIHFQKRGFQTTLDDSVKSFYIDKNGFTEKLNVGIPGLSDITSINTYILTDEIKDRINNLFNLIKKKKKGLKRRLLYLLTKQR